jgi:hypothetical protein
VNGFYHVLMIVAMLGDFLVIVSTLVIVCLSAVVRRVASRHSASPGPVKAQDTGIYLPKPEGIRRAS